LRGNELPAGIHGRCHPVVAVQEEEFVDDAFVVQPGEKLRGLRPAAVVDQGQDVRDKGVLLHREQHPADYARAR
jgi:hypothetical protein